jgi:hypothetical protein
MINALGLSAKVAAPTFLVPAERHSIFATNNTLLSDTIRHVSDQSFVELLAERKSAMTRISFILSLSLASVYGRYSPRFSSNQTGECDLCNTYCLSRERSCQTIPRFEHSQLQCLTWRDLIKIKCASKLTRSSASNRAMMLSLVLLEKQELKKSIAENEYADASYEWPSRTTSQTQAHVICPNQIKVCQKELNPSRHRFTTKMKQSQHADRIWGTGRTPPLRCHWIRSDIDIRTEILSYTSTKSHEWSLSPDCHAESEKWLAMLSKINLFFFVSREHNSQRGRPLPLREVQRADNSALEWTDSTRCIAHLNCPMSIPDEEIFHEGKMALPFAEDEHKRFCHWTDDGTVMKISSWQAINTNVGKTYFLDHPNQDLTLHAGSVVQGIDTNTVWPQGKQFPQRVQPR